MKYQYLTLKMPDSPYLVVGLLLFGVIMLVLNAGMIIAMRYERRVR